MRVIAQRFVSHVQNFALAACKTPVEMIKARAALLQRFKFSQRIEHGLTSRLNNESRSHWRGFGRFVVNNDPAPGARQKRSGGKAGDPGASDGDVQRLSNLAIPA